MKPKRLLAIIVVLAVFIPLGINFLILVGNWIFQVTGLNISALGLTNQDWVAFWAAYLGGIATVVAVWSTVYQTERHYLQTSKEQKRQNDELKKDQERQRRLDVLPLILLQQIVTVEASYLTLLIGGLEEPKKKDTIRVDNLKPIHEEYDVSEITIVFAPKIELRIGGLTEDEMTRVKNQGQQENRIVSHSEGKSITTTTLVQNSFSKRHPCWLVNVGKEAAINIYILLTRKNGQEYHLDYAFLLMAKQKIKLTFFVDVEIKDIALVADDYLLTFFYSDIYGNRYRQEYPIALNEQNFTLAPESNIKLDESQLGQTA